MIEKPTREHRRSPARRLLFVLVWGAAVIAMAACGAASSGSATARRSATQSAQAIYGEPPASESEASVADAPPSAPVGPASDGDSSAPAGGRAAPSVLPDTTSEPVVQGERLADAGAGGPSEDAPSPLARAGDAGALTAVPGQVSIPGGETLTPLYSATPAPPTATRTPTPTPLPAANRPSIGGCYVFPTNNSWNQDISNAPVDANSAAYITSIGATGYLHADFGGGGAYGIPYIVVPQTQPAVPVNFVDYGDESDPGPYPIPLTAPIEGGGVGDAHVLALQQGTCKLYEMFNAHPTAGAWNASSGAIFDLNSNALRPASWTSADAAGLPILPGLVRYDEVQAGAINHAVRFTVGKVQRAWVAPATHYGTSTDPNAPPYGAKLRLRATFDTSPYHGEALVVLTALKRYGMIVADQGTSWFITGAADPRWDDEDLNQLKVIPGNAFDVVQLGPITHY